MVLSATGLLASLNEEQRRVVSYCDGPMLVLAGAGSGKTRAVTHKIAWLLSQEGYLPHEILAVTFTNKAAQEMKKRLVKLVGLPGAGVEAGTFHGVCAKILRSHAQLLGFTQRFGILDTDDAKVLMRQVVQRMGLDHKQEYPPNQVLWIIDNLHNRRKSLDRWVGEASYGDQRTWRYTVESIATKYVERKRQLDMMDFGDLLGLCEKLLADHPEVGEQYRRRFRYVIVDEMQDTNATQLELLKLLLGSHNRICAVGDDDQSIYGWRGAQIANVLEFERSFPGALVIRMEQNYRSTGTILSAANSVVKKNQRRRDKRMWTENEDGEPIHLVHTDADGEEAHRVLQIVVKQHAAGTPLRQIAILYRTNAQSRPFEEAFTREGIPFVVVGGFRFYDRAEVKDAVAYLRLLSNPNDELAFRRVVNTPPRGIGDVTMEKLAAVEAAEGATLCTKALLLKEMGVRQRWAAPVVAFVELIERFRRGLTERPIFETIRDLLSEIGYYEYLSKMGDIEAESRSENVGQLINGIAQFEEERLAGGVSREAILQDYLENVALLSDIDQWKEEQDRVPLMTVHSSKGLEFDVVIVTGMEEGLFPYKGRGQQEEPDDEEERRLFYVALTRAAKRVFLTHCSSRRRFGQWESAQGSTFLKELDPKVLTREGRGVRRGFNEVVRERSQGAVQNWTGALVEHPKFGRGSVVATTGGSGESLTLYVKFGTGLINVRAMECTRCS